MKETEITSDWIDRYNDGELSESERIIFEDRMKTSPLLRSEVHVDAALNRLLNDSELLDVLHKINVARGKKRNKGSELSRLVAAACIICLAIFGGTFLLNRDAGQPGIFAERSISPAPVCNIQRDTCMDTTGTINIAARRSIALATNYIPLPEFEPIVGYATRTTLLRVTSPQPKATIPSGGALVFNWESMRTPLVVELEILDNRGVKVFAVHIADGSSYSFATSGLPDGLYYWKILANDDLAMMGKFLIMTLKTEND